MPPSCVRGFGVAKWACRDFLLPLGLPPSYQLFRPELLLGGSLPFWDLAATVRQKLAGIPTFVCDPLKHPAYLHPLLLAQTWGASCRPPIECVLSSCFFLVKRSFYSLRRLSSSIPQLLHFFRGTIPQTLEERKHCQYSLTPKNNC